MDVQSTGGGAGSWDIAADKTTVVLELIGKITSSRAMTEASDIQGGA